jgi:hypothetical protein
MADVADVRLESTAPGVGQAHCSGLLVKFISDSMLGREDGVVAAVTTTLQ